MKKAYLRRVTDDLYFISSRLKEVDPSYYVMYDLRRGRYEVHSDEQKGDTLCFVVPYGELDARTVEYAQKTRNPSFGRLPDEGKRRRLWSETC